MKDETSAVVVMFVAEQRLQVDLSALFVCLCTQIITLRPSVVVVASRFTFPVVVVASRYTFPVAVVASRYTFPMVVVTSRYTLPVADVTSRYTLPVAVVASLSLIHI